MKPEDLRENWKPGDVRRRAEAMVFRAFDEARDIQLTRQEILGVLGLGSFSPSQSRAIAQIDRAIASLVAERRVARVRKGLYRVPA